MAQPGEECYDFVEWLLEGNNTQTAPEALADASSVKGAQQTIYETMPGICARPCKTESLQCYPNCADTGGAGAGSGSSEMSWSPRKSFRGRGNPPGCCFKLLSCVAYRESRRGRVRGEGIQLTVNL